MKNFILTKEFSIKLIIFTQFLSLLTFSMSSQVLLHLSEELKFLIFLVSNDSSISIIWEVCLPFNIGSLIVSDWSQSDIPLNTGSSVSWFSSNDFITNRVSQVTDLNNSELPVGTIIIVDLDDWVQLIGTSSHKGGWLNFAWNNFLKFEFLEYVPCFTNGKGKDCWLYLMERDRDCRSASVNCFNHNF